MAQDDNFQFYDKDGELINLKALFEYGAHHLNVISISSEHQRIHSGQSFTTGHLWEEGTAVADNANAEILLVTGSTHIHLIQDVSVGGDCVLNVIEGVTATPGTALTVFNKARTSSNTTGATASYAPTGVSGGAALPPKFIPGGSGFLTQGGQDGSYNRELNLKTNTNYLFRVTNRSGLATQIAITLEWYDTEAGT